MDPLAKALAMFHGVNRGLDVSYRVVHDLQIACRLGDLPAVLDIEVEEVVVHDGQWEKPFPASKHKDSKSPTSAIKQTCSDFVN